MDLNERRLGLATRNREHAILHSTAFHNSAYNALISRPLESVELKDLSSLTIRNAYIHIMPTYIGGGIISIPRATIRQSSKSLSTYQLAINSHRRQA